MFTSPRIAAIGECMIEVACQQEWGPAQLGFAGDTLNTAIYLVRVNDTSKMHYITALGDDDFSALMLHAWQKEGIVITEVLQIPGELPGLYLIRNHPNGEKKFFYYRSQSAVRQMLEGASGDSICERLLNFDVIFLTGITLAIFSKLSRHKLIEVIQQSYAKKCIIVFDSNFRASLWDSRQEAQQVISSIFPYVTIALPSFPDEKELFGDKTPAHTIGRLRQSGIDEIAMKLGEEGYYLSNPQGEIQVPVRQRVAPVIDTSGAGDAFNGVYLGLRLQNYSEESAARQAASVAAVVLRHRGAIIPRDAMPGAREMR